MKKGPAKRHARRIEEQPSHSRFEELIGYCVRGRSNPVLQSCVVDDHIAELCMLLHDDTDDDLWSRDDAAAAGREAGKILDGLADRARRQADERAANLLYSIATQAAYDVLYLYLRHRELFDRIAPRRKLLPCLLSVHPRTGKITTQMRRDARLGEQTDDARRVGSKAWFLNDAPANVYARAILASVEFNRELLPASCQQYGWAKFDRTYGVRTVVLPFPKYVEGLDRLPIPITPKSVPDYWRKGKEMILEEMPKFHERPEWRDYHTKRHYAHGAKTGAIQHAIFKDILAALRTIAGANKRSRQSAASPRSPATK